MKKFYLLLALSMFIMLNFSNNAFADDYEMKAQLAAKRQIYKVQISVLDKDLKQTLNEYSNVLLNEKLKENEKEKQMNALEEKITQINIKKQQLREKYINEKKQLKEEYKD